MESTFLETLAEALWKGMFSDTWIKPPDLVFFVLLGIVGYLYFNWSDKRELDEVNKWEFQGTREEANNRFVMHRAGLVAQIAVVAVAYIAFRNWSW